VPGVYARRVPTKVDHDGPVRTAPHATTALTDTQRGPRAADLMLADCRMPGSDFESLVSDVARETGADIRGLAVRALLHLPRVATFKGRVSRKQAARELFRSARRMQASTVAARDLIPDQPRALQELVFGLVSAPAAERLFTALHYLGSARPGSENFALLDPATGRPVTICSVSPLEWKRVGRHLHSVFGVSPQQIWDVSRVYSCAVAPPNAISFLLSRVRSALRNSEHDVQLLTTAVDPNLGFTGSSYRAANWQQWLTIQPRPYLYRQQQYVSPRQLRQQFGTSSLAELQARYPGQRFEQSKARLLDSLIFCCRVSRETEPVEVRRQRPLHR
jgi:hypothetical protein